MRRWTAAIAALAVALTMLIGNVTGFVGAQDEAATPLPETESVAESSLTFNEALAAELGIAVDDLEVAVESARESSGQDGSGIGGNDGHRGGSGGPGKSGGRSSNGGGCIGVGAAELATFLAVTEDQIKADRESGLNILEIAIAHGKTQDELRAFLIGKSTTRIDERLAELATTAEDAGDSGTPAASI